MTLSLLELFARPDTWATVFFLVFLEGVLSIDNALVLALLAGNLPEAQQKKALTYGFVGAIAFRTLAVFFASTLVKFLWVKILGGLYLAFLAGKHFWDHRKKSSDETLDSDKATEQKATKKRKSFWTTVLVIELTDIAFAVDSILAAVALTKHVPIIILGGILGTLLMRFSAVLLIGLLKRFSNLEHSAYLLVGLIGSKVLIESADLNGVDFHSPKNIYFWIFWAMLCISLLFGFKKPSKSDST